MLRVGCSGSLALHQPQVGQSEVPLRPVLSFVGGTVAAKEHQVRFFKFFDV